MSNPEQVLMNDPTRDERADLEGRISHECRDAESKFPRWPTDPIHMAAILGEEAGETLQAAIDLVYADGSEDRVIHEARQAAAMGMRILMYYERKRTGRLRRG